MAIVTLGYTIIYNANGGHGGPGSQQGVETGPPGAQFVVNLSSSTPVLSGAQFRGWGTSANASSASYGAGNGYVFTLPESGSQTVTVNLYAVWGYLVTYNGNATNVSNLPSSQYKIRNITLSLSSKKPTRPKSSNGTYTVTFNANGGSCSTSSLTANKYTTYPFVNWKVVREGGTEYYNAGGSYTKNQAAVMQAQWTTGSSVEEIELPTPTKSGYYCTGWYTAASGGTKKGEPGGSFTPSANITLYAQWSSVVLPNTYTVYVVQSGTPLTLQKYNVYVVVNGALQKYNVKIAQDL